MSEKLRDMAREADVLVARLGEFADVSAQQSENTTRMPIFEETRHRARKAVDHVNAMLRPTFDSLTNQRTRAELMERVYRKLNRPLTVLEQCMVGAMDHHDALACQTRLLDQLERAVPAAVADILRDY